MGLDTVELALAVERAFDIELPDEAAGKILTVAELHTYVVAQLAGQGRVIDGDATYDLLRKLICSHLGVEPGKVVPGARFVQDLGAG